MTNLHIHSMIFSERERDWIKKNVSLRRNCKKGNERKETRRQWKWIILLHFLTYHRWLEVGSLKLNCFLHEFNDFRNLQRNLKSLKGKIQNWHLMKWLLGEKVLMYLRNRGYLLNCCNDTQSSSSFRKYCGVPAPPCVS